VRVQNDGLSQAPLFEYEDERVYALTNRLCALRALGVRPKARHGALAPHESSA